MNLTELTGHIKKVMQDEVTPLVKDAVEAAVKKTCDEVGGGDERTKREKEVQDALLATARQKAEDDAARKAAGDRRQKGEAIGAVVRAVKKSRNDVDGTILYLKKDGHSDLAQMFIDKRKELEDMAADMSKAMTAGDPETGGILIPQPVAAEIIDLLRAKVIVRKMNPITIPMPNGNFRLPKKTLGTNSYYVGESTSPTTSTVKMGSVLLAYKKQVTVVPISNDLLKYSSPGADQIVRNDIVDETAVRQDQAFMRDTGTDATPKGIRYWAASANVFPATGGVGGDSNLTAVTATLSKLLLRLLQANIPMSNVHWIMSPRTYMSLSSTRITNGPYAFRDEMARGTLWGYPFLVSTTVLNTLSDGTNSDCSELYLVDAGEVVIGDSQRLMIDASSDAAYEEGGTVKAAFTRDETVVRAISEHDIVVRREEAVAIATQLRWGA